MTVRVGINGFGRIGRNFLRAARDQGTDIEVLAVNDLTSAETLAHLLRYDSTHGRFPGDVQVMDGHLVIDGHRSPCCPSGTRRPCPGASWAWTWSSSRPGCSPTRESAAAHLRTAPTGSSSPPRRPTRMPPS